MLEYAVMRPVLLENFELGCGFRSWSCVSSARMIMTWILVSHQFNCAFIRRSSKLVACLIWSHVKSCVGGGLQLVGLVYTLLFLDHYHLTSSGPTTVVLHEHVQCRTFSIE